MGKQLLAGSTDAEAAMGQMTLENIPMEIQHGQQQNVEDTDDASMSAISVLLDAAVDFGDNNPSPAEKPSEVMDLASNQITTLADMFIRPKWVEPFTGRLIDD
jgi:hypothetical protein